VTKEKSLDVETEKGNNNNSNLYMKERKVLLVCQNILKKEGKGKCQKLKKYYNWKTVRSERI
jgi:hypothetical protein